MSLIHVATEVAQNQAVQRTLWEWLLMVSGGIGVVSGAAVVVWKVAIRPHFEEFVRKAAEVHKSVTVNGGKNSPPTLRDDISNLRQGVAEVRGQVQQLVAQGGALAQGNADIRDQVHDLRTLTEDTREDLKHHVESGEKYLGQVRLAFEQQGIELPPADQ